MKYSVYGFNGLAIMLFTVNAVSDSMARGMRESSDTATADLSVFGWIHVACCGVIVLIGIILLLFGKLKGRGND